MRMLGSNLEIRYVIYSPFAVFAYLFYLVPLQDDFLKFGGDQERFFKYKQTPVISQPAGRSIWNWGFPCNSSSHGPG